MQDKALQEALEGLAGYLVDRMDANWTHVTVEIVYLADDVVKLSGEYTGQSGASVGLAFDQDVIAITDSIREALGEPEQGQVQAMHFALKADGALSVEFTYADAA